MNKSYEKGKKFEYTIRKHLETKGYFVVRQAKSSFPDLIGLSEGKAILVECKTGQNPRITATEIRRMRALIKKTGCRGFVYKKQPYKKLIVSEII